MAFVILNADDTIHSFQGGEYEVLDEDPQALKRRFDIDAMPNFSSLNGAFPAPVDTECYTWDNVNETIVLKAQTDINAILIDRTVTSKKLEKRGLQGEIDKITALETSDPNEDYSVEKMWLQVKLDTLKVT